MSVKWDIGFEIILVSEIQHMIILWGGITMKFKIGFSGYEEEQQTAEQLAEMPGEMQPVKSVVQVRFPSQGPTTTALICTSATSSLSRESSRA